MREQWGGTTQPLYSDLLRDRKFPFRSTLWGAANRLKKFFVFYAGNRVEVCYIRSLASSEATKKNAFEGNSGEIPGRGRHRTVGPLLKLKSFAWCHGPDIPFGVFFSGHPFGFSPAKGEHA